MGNKRDFILGKANRQIRKTNIFLRILVTILTCLVLYDSIIHDVPLYYIFFYLTGLVVGRFFRLTRMVEHDSEGEQFVLKTNKWDLVLSISLLLFRFVFGSMILESAHVAFASVGLSLLFIGIYRSKWKGLVSQIDEIVYTWQISKTEEENNPK